MVLSKFTSQIQVKWIVTKLFQLIVIQYVYSMVLSKFTAQIQASFTPAPYVTLLMSC